MPISQLASETLIANPTLNADPRRYSHHDGNDQINRFVQQLRFFLPWRRISGQFLEVRGHDPDSRGVEARFYNHAATTATPQGVESTSYEFAPLQTIPTQQFVLKEISALFDSRNFSQQNLSSQINLVRFQKQALRHAICSQLEFGLINGNAATNPAEFDGLRRLVDRGMGQRLVATPGDELNILDRAMSLIRSHNRLISLIVMNQGAWLRVLELQRNLGFRPEFRNNRRIRQRILHVDGVPVCLSDQIASNQSSTGLATTSVFFLSFGRNGVFGLQSRKRPGIFFSRTSQPNAPFTAYMAQLYCGLASMTSDALVEVANWNVALEGS
jgi:hypothetical protein